MWFLGDCGKRLGNEQGLDNWIQNPKQEYFQWELLLDIALGVGFVPDVCAQEYQCIFISYWVS